MSSSDTPAAAATRDVDIVQQCKSSLPRSPLDQSNVENNQIVGVMHADERRGMKKPAVRQLKDELVEVLGWHAKCIHQGCLDGAGYLGNPGLVVAAFDNVDFRECHDRSPLCCHSRKSTLSKAATTRPGLPRYPAPSRQP